jgi:hypothetical protein
MIVLRTILSLKERDEGVGGGRPWFVLLHHTRYLKGTVAMALDDLLRACNPLRFSICSSALSTSGPSVFSSMCVLPRPLQLRARSRDACHSPQCAQSCLKSHLRTTATFDVFFSSSPPFTPPLVPS